MDNANTLGILRQLERGEISAAAADTQLTAPPLVERIAAPPFEQAQIPAWVQRIGIIVLTAGIAVVLLGAWIIAATVRANILWLLFGLPLVLLGSLALALGASGFSGHWLYVNVEPSRKHHRAFRFAFPFPMGLLRLGLWIAQWIQPRPRARVRVSTTHSKFDALWDDPDELIDALARELREGRGITIDVDENGERVQVYIM
ncbi:MAG: hypothetical protein AB1817_02810 [Chloroflexota bacterium]